MKRFGVVSYNMHCNFTNYGSALQSWALCKAIEKTGNQSVLIDYCPEVLKDKNPLDPFRNMWDRDEESRRMVESSMPAIRVNFAKFDRFYRERCPRSVAAYTARNFDTALKRENLDGFVCGSDTIFCPDEFGIDDGYYANYATMQGRSIAYAASFGTPHFRPEELPVLDARMRNFKAIGLRETTMIDRIRASTEVPVGRVCDPTLLLGRSDYDRIAESPERNDPFLLLYSRRNDSRMTAFASDLARRNGWRVVEISIRASHAELGHEMRYDAGVEEFLGLVRESQCVVTNSYHGMIFAVLFERPFCAFAREQCDTKLDELVARLGLGKQRGGASGFSAETISVPDWDSVKAHVSEFSDKSFAFLRDSLNLF